MTWLFLIPLVVAALCWLSAWAVFRHLITGPTAHRNGCSVNTKVSVIIPARNEERNLARLLPSLNNQVPPFDEILVVDDLSSDRTASVAGECGVTVIEGAELPEGWNGKPWALKQGRDAAKGDWLLFLDADTVALPGFSAALAEYSGSDASAFSFCPYHRIERVYENLSAFFHLSMNIGTNAFGWKGNRASPIEFVGQCLFVRAADYDRIGGHESVKDVVLENFHLAKQYRKSGLTYRTLSGKNLLEMRMYPDGYRTMREGWIKGFSSGAESTPPSAMISLSIWFSGLSITAVALFLGPFLPAHVALFASGLYFLYVLQCVLFFRQIGNYSIFTSVFFPVTYGYYLQLFLRGCMRRAKGDSVRWKGRDVV